MTQSEKEALYTENTKFIHFFLKKYFSNFNKSYEDFYMEASLTFFEVIDKYSPDKGTLTTFLTPYLNHNISTYIAHQIFHSTIYYYRTMAQILKADIEFDKYAATFSDEEISKISKSAKLSELTVRNTLKHRLAGKYLSFNTSPAVSSVGYTIDDSHIQKTKQAEDIRCSLNQLNAIDQTIRKNPLLQCYM